jgi:hypothetical protein
MIETAFNEAQNDPSNEQPIAIDQQILPSIWCARPFGFGFKKGNEPLAIQARGIDHFSSVFDSIG